MKTMRYYIMIAAMVLMAACSSDSFTDDNTSGTVLGKTVRIAVGIDDTRISYNDADDIRPFAWEEGDTIVAAGYDATDAFVGTSLFLMTEMNNGSAAFSGRLIQGAAKYVLYYKSPRLTVSESGKAVIDYSGQTQNNADPAAHVKHYMLMASAFIPAADMENDAEKMLGIKNSMLRLDVKSMPEAVGALNEISLYTNLGTPEMASAKIAVTGASASPFKVFMMIDPETTAQAEGNTFALLFRGTSAYSVMKNNSKALFAEGGMRYNLIVYQNEELEAGKKGLNNWAPGLTETDAAKHSVDVLVPGGLSAEAIAQAAGDSKQLVITGKLNGADMKVLREAAGCDDGISANTNPTLVKHLDMTDAYIVKSDDVYYTYNDGMTTLEDLRITEDNVISDYMFNESKLISIKLPASVTKLENFVFLSSNELNDATMYNVETIGTHAFFNCVALINVNFGTAIKTLGDSMFYSDGKLQTLTIPSTVTSLGVFLFEKCNGLQSFKLECKKETTVLDPNTFSGEDTDFSGCTLMIDESWAADVDFAASTFYGHKWKSVLTLDGKPFCEADAASHTITVAMPGLITDETITEALNGGKKLTVAGPINAADIRLIREAAGCVYSWNDPQGEPKITSLDLSNAKIIAGSGLYDDQHKITADNTIDTFMFNRTKLTSIKLPNNTAAIGGEVFAGSTISSISIPADVSVIGNSSFISCHNLANVTFEGNKIEELSNSLFFDCQMLKSMTIPSSVKTIGVSCFQYSGLETVTIPSSVTMIDEHAFDACNSLTTFAIGAKNAGITINPQAFGTASATSTIDLRIDESWAADIDFAQKQFKGFTWKSIARLDGTPFPNIN